MNRDVPSVRLPSKQIVLLGIGHTNAHIVRMWGMNPIADAALTCVSDNTIATYSGMLPAVLAGQKPREAMEIDLVRLCSSVGARLITNAVTGLDRERRQVQFADRPPVPFDALSIGIGSVPSTARVQIEGSSLLKIKPMQTFLERLSVAVDESLERMHVRTQENAAAPPTLKVAIAGGGAAGIEVAFCLPGFLRTKTSVPFLLQIVTRNTQILDGVIPSMRNRVYAELMRREFRVTTRKTIVEVSEQGLTVNDGTHIEADLVIWATGATSPELISKLDLPLDDRGFLATDNRLQSTSGLPIFAVGDTGTIVSEKLPKAGVYAVRQGPILWKNIQSTLAGEPLTPYEPQKSFLKLLNTGDGRAIGEWKGFSFGGRLAMKLKERIDTRFMKMFQVQDTMNSAAEPMQCQGCGCKLGGEVLNGVLNELQNRKLTGPSTQAEPLDDAAIIETSAGQIVASTDFFSSPFEDPYLAGRIVALHSASDLIAMGATVKAALAIVVLPEGDPRSQRQALNDLLAGAQREFEVMGADLVGGHTIVGPRWEVGFTVIGEPHGHALLRKQDLQTGDLLYVTKPLGIGVLLAAHMRSQCSARDYESLIEAMLQRQHAILPVVEATGLTAGTDITGFGLAGHLIEMLKSSHKSAKIELDRLPLLSGAAEAIGNGIESTLAPDNRHVERLISVSESQRQRVEYKVLFDPQTSGGLLLGVASKVAASFEQNMMSAGFDRPVLVGQVGEVRADGPRLNIS